MATTSKTKKATTPEQQPGELPLHIDRKRQIRLGTGIFFLLCGVLTCFSIFSYFFTWTEDADKVSTVNSISGFFRFLFFDKATIANHGGRLGAAVAYVLVSKGAGIAAIAIGCAIVSVGLNLIYGKKALHIMRYLRWLSILLLLTAPILSYIFPGNPFPSKVVY